MCELISPTGWGQDELPGTLNACAGSRALQLSTPMLGLGSVGAYEHKQHI